MVNVALSILILLIIESDDCCTGRLGALTGRRTMTAVLYYNSITLFRRARKWHAVLLIFKEMPMGRVSVFAAYVSTQ